MTYQMVILKLKFHLNILTGIFSTGVSLIRAVPDCVIGFNTDFREAVSGADLFGS